MKIETKSAGILDNFGDISILDKKESWPLARFLEFLDRKLENRLRTVLLSDGKLREDICILLNGRNIRILPDGLETQLNDGDSVFICVVVSGG